MNVGYQWIEETCPHGPIEIPGQSGHSTKRYDLPQFQVIITFSMIQCIPLMSALNTVFLLVNVAVLMLYYWFITLNRQPLPRGPSYTKCWVGPDNSWFHFFVSESYTACPINPFVECAFYLCSFQNWGVFVAGNECPAKIVYITCGLIWLKHKSLLITVKLKKAYFR